MIGFERSDDYQPLFWVGGRPIHVTTFLVIVHGVAMVGCCLLRGFNLFDPLQWMAFSSEAVLRHGQIWRVVTYAFAHSPSIGFLIDMALLFLFGREVERFFGRKVFATLYAGLVLSAPTVLLLTGMFRGTGEQELMLLENASGFGGSSMVTFGVFIAFATIYPSVQIFFGIPCVWIASALLSIFTLALFGNHYFVALTVLWTESTVAFLGSRYMKMGSDAFAFFGNLRERFPRKTTPRGVRPRLKPRRAIDASEPAEPVGALSNYRPAGDVHESIDPLLDKISKHGLASLTHSERATLERARVSLLRKDRGG